MSDTDSDNQESNMEVDKLAFLNSFFSESVPDISPECPTDLFLSPEVIQGVGISGSDQTLYSESNPARNSSSITSVAPYKFNGTLGSGLKTPSKRSSPVNFSSGYSSSSLATPEPSSGDGQVFLSTPTSNFTSYQDEESVQTLSNVFCPKNIPSASRFSLDTTNNVASGSHAKNENDLDPINIMSNLSSVSCPSSGFGQHQGSNDTARPNSLASSTFVPSVPSTSKSSFQGHQSNMVRVHPSAQLFPKTIPYLDQLDSCFDSQLSPAPFPSQVSSDHLNNNSVVEVNDIVVASPSVSPVVQVSSPVAVLLQPRTDQNPEVQNLKSKKLRSLKPRLLIDTQEANPTKIPTPESNFESRNLAPGLRIAASSADSSSRNQGIFKTDISSFYSNSAIQVLPAVQLGQNTIPLAKKRRNSAEFWNVELFEDGTEDLFIEKPKKFRDRRKKKGVDKKESKEVCDIVLFEDCTEDLFAKEQKSFRDHPRKKVVKKAKVTVPDQPGPDKLPSEKPGPFKVSSDQPGLIKVPSDKPGILNSIRIAPPIVTRKGKVDVKSASLVQTTKLSKAKKKGEVSHDCTGCVDLRLQLKKSEDNDVENNLGDVSELSNLCGDCGTEISLKSEVGKELFDNVEAFERKEDLPKDMSTGINESEDDNDVGKLVINVEVAETASSRESEEDTTMSGSTTVSPDCSPSLYPAVCWSCKSTRSLGSWHAHKWQQDKFLCSSCFNFYKEKNAESSKKKAFLPRKKVELSHQLANISKVIKISVSESSELPQFMPSLQNLPPGTYDFSAQDETDLTQC